ncbi:hypothetical protein ASPTUDRAFT_381681 [Aspergillus tubingensis CBS 134.48]|uniref:Uncharacterized protein n=1 Tax=Aspergillus tubingensis (strain CBS 134.48) TaxID=767770 RepID=A0A1L9NH84_ASPTC|nr:hypothetical protein ASPTUDRAFT_381681 [Aspergillus tubingensis CBS 134.48]
MFFRFLFLSAAHTQTILIDSQSRNGQILSLVPWIDITESFEGVCPKLPAAPGARGTFLFLHQSLRGSAVVPTPPLSPPRVMVYLFVHLRTIFMTVFRPILSTRLKLRLNCSVTGLNKVASVRSTLANIGEKWSQTLQLTGQSFSYTHLLVPFIIPGIWLRFESEPGTSCFSPANKPC